MKTSIHYILEDLFLKGQTEINLYKLYRHCDLTQDFDKEILFLFEKGMINIRCRYKKPFPAAMENKTIVIKKTILL